MYLEYDLKYKDAVKKLREWYALPHENDKALREALWTNYKNDNLDPDGKAIQYVDAVPCTADALLSIYRICMMEGKKENIIPMYEKYRKKPIFFFPREQGGINQTRASVFGDKIDYTLLDIKRYYLHQKCQMKDTYEKTKTKAWLDAMYSFENLVEWYGIKGIFVDEEYHVINIETGMPFDENGENVVEKRWSAAYYQNIKIKSDLWEQLDELREYDFGITPHGTKFFTYFINAEGKSCNKDSAVKYHIVEYTMDGRFVQETIN